MKTLHDPLLLIIVLLSLTLGSATLTRGHEWGDDWASYVMQSQSILRNQTHDFVEHNAFTIFNSSMRVGPVAYPWGYPLIITPALILKGLHPLTLKLPGLFLFAGFLICLYLLIKKHITRTESLLIVSLFAFSPALIKFLDQILSDIPFLFIISLALLLLAKSKNSIKDSVILGVVIFFAFFIRTTGIVLLASFLVHQAICFLTQKENRKEIFVNSIIATTIFGVAWIVTSSIFPNGQGSYLDQLKGLTPTIFKENIVYYIYLFNAFFDPESIGRYAYYGLIALFLLGTWTRAKFDTPMIIFFVLYLIALFFWPERQGIRFIFPLLPLFIYFIFQGSSFVVKKLPDRSQVFVKGITYVFWLAIIGIFLFNSGTRAYNNLKDERKINGPFDSASMEVYDFIKTQTPSDSVIVFFKPRAMRLFTNRDTLMSTECDRLQLGDYVVLSYKAENSQIPPTEIDNCGLALSKVFENNKFIVYQMPQ